MKKHALVVIASLIASPALAGEAPFAPLGRADVQPASTRASVSPTQGTWDFNRDGEISDAEIRLGFQHVGTFDTWDLDDNGLIDQEELAAGLASTPLYSNIDRDGDGYIQGDELSLAAGDIDDLEGWDLNADDRLTENELYLGLFRAWSGEDVVVTQTTTVLDDDELDAVEDVEGQVVVESERADVAVVEEDIDDDGVAVVEDIDVDDIYLSRAEFHDGFADLWDTDNDGEVDVREFRTGWSYLTVSRAPAV